METPAQNPAKHASVIQLKPWILGLIVLLPCLVSFGLWIVPHPIAEIAAKPAPIAIYAPLPAPPPELAPTPNRRVGPWGTLTTTPVVIQPPIRLIPPVLYQPKPLNWQVGGANEAAFRQLLTEAGVADAEQNTLIKSLVKRDDGSVVLVVDPNLVRALPPAVRGHLYRSLVQLDPRNRIFFGNKRWTPEQWAELRATLPANVQKVVDGFLFPASNGTDVLFWDTSAALHFIPSEIDRIALLRALNIQRTLLLQLSVDSHTKVTDLAEYWHLSTNRRQFIPMLESLAQLEGTHSIDALYLMPGFVRDYVYTYPVSTLVGTAADTVDCFWTCANFDRKPNEPVISTKDAAKYLTSNYVTYIGRPEFGDIIVLRDAQENAIHVAVHIADNIVFTKNGQHPLMPWVFMERDDMIRIYELADPTKTLWVRRATD